MTLPLNIGWIGIGQMGYPMAAQLAKKLQPGSTLYINDVNKQIIEKFVTECHNDNVKIVVCDSARQVAENAEIIQSIVPEASHVRAVYLGGNNGVIHAKNLGSKLFIDSSTIDTASSLEVGQELKKVHSNVKFIDAPVSGGTAGAEKAILTFMVGLSKEDQETTKQLETLLSLMGKQITFCGAPSLGLAAKLCNNYCSGLIALATAESMNIGVRLGLDPRVLSECMAGSSGGSWVNSTVNPCPGVCPDAVTSKDYKGGFKVQLMRKDLGLAIESARSVNAKLALAEAGFNAYDSASKDENCTDRDSRVVYRWLGGIEDIVQKIDQQKQK